MKKKSLLLLTLLSVFIISSQAQVVSITHEDGLLFPEGESGTLDVNFDGSPDILIDNYSGFINLTPMNYNACISIENDASESNGMFMRTFDFGQEVEDMVSLDPSLGFSFNDDDDDSLLKDDGTLYDNWDNLEEKYLGFFNFNTNSTGWLKVKIDMSDHSLYIMSIAYESTPWEKILVGDVGELASHFDFTLDQNSVSFENFAFNADSYSWDFGDGTTSIVEHPSHIYAVSGFYDVCLTAFDDVESITTCKTVNALISGIEDFVGQNIQLYPNPVQTEARLYFELKNSQEISISIFDVIGAQILVLNPENYSSGAHYISLPVSHLKAGQYYVNITQGSEVLKVMKLQKTE